VLIIVAVMLVLRHRSCLVLVRDVVVVVPAGCLVVAVVALAEGLEASVLVGGLVVVLAECLVVVLIPWSSGNFSLFDMMTCSFVPVAGP
jgi:F0F1-type ATP synthase assembly protein I